MATPVLIDTDMGVDDAVAITLALCASEIELVGLVSVGGNVALDQATTNIGRLLGGLKFDGELPIGRGLDQERNDLKDATHVFGPDGLGEVDLPAANLKAAKDYLELYEQLIGEHGESLVIVAIGPLTNLAGVLRDQPDLLKRVGRIVVMGGAIWCPGNVNEHAEFNFYRDPQAAKAVFSAGLPVTVVPLDVTCQVAVDESHVAHLACSGTRSGELLARMIQYAIEQNTQPIPGTFLVHDALAIGVLLWPELFMRSKMGLDMVVSGAQAGRCKPRVAKDKSKQLAVVISVNVLDFLENLVEQLCHEKFVV